MADRGAEMGKSARRQDESAVAARTAPAALCDFPSADRDLAEPWWTVPMWLKLSVWTAGLAVAGWIALDAYQVMWVPPPPSPLMGDIADFSVSHAGNRVVVLRRGPGTSRLATLVDLRTRKTTPLQGDWAYGGAQWSPNDEYVAGPVRRGNALTPMLVHVPSRRHFPVELPDKRARAHSWRWSPDGRSALVEATMEPGVGSQVRWQTQVSWVYEYDLGTHSVTPVCPGELFSVPQPYWGNAIIYEVTTGRIDPPQPYRRSCFLGLDQGDPDPCQVLPKHWVYEVVVSPNGRRAVVDARPLVEGREPVPVDEDAPPTLYRLDYPSDRHYRRLCDGVFYDLTWSKAGDRLLACDQSAQDRLNADIVTIDGSTGAVTALRDSEGRDVTGSDPVWIDDDRAIAYVRWYGPAAGSCTRRLWTYTFATGKARQVYPFVD
jgi:hypothetical protein